MAAGVGEAAGLAAAGLAAEVLAEREVLEVGPFNGIHQSGYQMVLNENREKCLTSW